MNGTAFWQWNRSVPAAVCNALIEECKTATFGEAQVQLPDGPESFGVDTQKRNNKAVFLQPNHWMEGILANHCRYANNQAGWGMFIHGSEPVQVSKYEAGERYDWHTDGTVLSPDKKPIRKLTAVIQLTPASEFDGGGLFIDGFEGSVLKDQGDVVVFPSFLRHKAEVIKYGVRQTAVLWMIGPAFI